MHAPDVEAKFQVYVQLPSHSLNLYKILHFILLLLYLNILLKIRTTVYNCETRLF